jgi:hypothetical protein
MRFRNALRWTKRGRMNNKEKYSNLTIKELRKQYDEEVKKDSGSETTRSELFDALENAIISDSFVSFLAKNPMANDKSLTETVRTIRIDGYFHGNRSPLSAVLAIGRVFGLDSDIYRKTVDFTFMSFPQHVIKENNEILSEELLPSYPEIFAFAKEVVRNKTRSNADAKGEPRRSVENLER